MLDHDVRVAPSLLSADFTRLADELDDIATADLLHFDVMDGHFVPNLSFGVGVLSQVKRATDLPVDVHLMVSNPEECVPWYLDAGADVVSFHWEAQTHARRLVSLIHEAGVKAAVALNPATPVSCLEELVDELDMVLVMTVNPGFGGQGFIEGSLAKLRRLKALCSAHGVSPRVEVDGGISAGNAAAVAAAGADVLVAGSAVFGAQDRAQAIRSIRDAALGGLARRA